MMKSPLDCVCIDGSGLGLAFVLAPRHKADVDLAVAEDKFVYMQTQFVGETKEGGLGSVQVIPGQMSDWEELDKSGVLTGGLPGIPLRGNCCADHIEFAGRWTSWPCPDDGWKIVATMFGSVGWLTLV